MALLGAALALAGCSPAPRALDHACAFAPAALAWTPDGGSIVVVEPGHGLEIVDAATGAIREHVDVERTAPRRDGTVAMAADGTIAFCADDSVRVRGAARTLAFAGRAGALSLSPDGRRLAAADAGTVRVLDLAGDEAPWAGLAEGGMVFSPTGALARINGSRVELLDSTYTQPIAAFGPIAPTALHELAFTRTGGTLAVFEEPSSISFWDVAGRRLRWRIRMTDDSRFERGVLSPDGVYVACAHRGRVSVRWAYTSARVATWLAHGGMAVRDLAFSPDGRALASVGDDGHLRVHAIPAPPKGTR